MTPEGSRKVEELPSQDCYQVVFHTALGSGKVEDSHTQVTPYSQLKLLLPPIQTINTQHLSPTTYHPTPIT